MQAGAKFIRESIFLLHSFGKNFNATLAPAVRRMNQIKYLVIWKANKLPEFIDSQPWKLK
jgi:hypothetical protein